MKIGITTEVPDLTSMVESRFGISKYLLIWDSETRSLEAVRNEEDISGGQHGIQMVILAISKKVEIVITGYLSPNAEKYLTQNGIRVLSGFRGTALTAIEAALADDVSRQVLKKDGTNQKAKIEIVPALRQSLRQFWGLVPVMVCLNLFIHPGSIVKFVGEKSGLRGALLAAAAGVVSMGPIYAWYPFLKEVRSKGAGYEPIAVFLNSRTVKPVLLPVMISYFGWVFTLMLTLFTILGAFTMGRIMGYILKNRN